MSAILIDSGIVHYEVIGRGRPIIFVHGWVGSWRYWIPALQTTSTNFRAYALDLWAFGDSAHEEERYSLDKQVELIDRFLNEMGIGRVALVGHGLGGVVSLLFASRSPQVVDRVMAIDVPLDYGAINSRMRTSMPTELADWLVAKTPVHEPARMDAAKTDPKAVMSSFVDSNALNIGNRLYLGTTPVLLVYGQNDPAINVPNIDPTSMSEMVHSITFEGAGHFPMLDDSARFNRLLTDWTALQSGESPRDLQLKEEWRRRVR